MDKNNRIHWVDYMRLIAMIAVICNHSWGYFSVDNFEKYDGSSIYYIDIILNTFTRFDVPFF